MKDRQASFDSILIKEPTLKSHLAVCWSAPVATSVPEIYMVNVHIIRIRNHTDESMKYVFHYSPCNALPNLSVDAILDSISVMKMPFMPTCDRALWSPLHSVIIHKDSHWKVITLISVITASTAFQCSLLTLITSTTPDSLDSPSEGQPAEFGHQQRLPQP